MPDVTGRQPLEAFIGFKLTAAEAWRVRRAAFRRRVTISDFVRAAITAAMTEGPDQ